jgi:hypothetical protein
LPLAAGNVDSVDSNATTPNASPGCMRSLRVGSPSRPSRRIGSTPTSPSGSTPWTGTSWPTSPPGPLVTGTNLVWTPSTSWSPRPSVSTPSLSAVCVRAAEHTDDGDS